MALVMAVTLNLIVGIGFPYDESFEWWSQSFRMFVFSLFALVLAISYVVMCFYGQKISQDLYAKYKLGEHQIFSLYVLFGTSALAGITVGSVHVTVGIIGVVQVVNSVVLLLSYLGNHMSHFIYQLQEAGSKSSSDSAVSKEMVFHDSNLIYHVLYICVSLLGLTWDWLPFSSSKGYGEFWYRCVQWYRFLTAHHLLSSLLLVDLVMFNATLRNVIRSVTRNGKSILLTAMFAFILVFLFSIIGFIFFKVNH